MQTEAASPPRTHTHRPQELQLSSKSTASGGAKHTMQELSTRSTLDAELWGRRVKVVKA